MDEFNVNEIPTTEPDPAEEVGTPEKAPNYRKLYREKCAELKATEAKLAELQHICKSFAEQKAQIETKFKQTALEYKAIAQYMLDVVKHSYLSLQFARQSKKESVND